MEPEQHIQPRHSKGRKNQKHLVFSIASDSYCVPLQSIKEIIGTTKVAPIPNVPPYVLGLLNLRGQIISVIDLRTKLGLPYVEPETMKNSIVISQVENLTVGFLVDEVIAVDSVSCDAIEQVSDVGEVRNKEYITGIAKNNHDDSLKLILDLSKILSAELINTIAESQGAA